MFLLISTAVYGQPYDMRYGKECVQTEMFYSEVFVHSSALKESSHTPEFLFAIVAPEMSQYHFLRDKVEQSALFALYAYSGRAYADFSVGVFQMKPSFIEAIEECVRESDDLSDRFSDYIIECEKAEEGRVERLRRLSSVDWQIGYLVIFGEIMNNRFHGILFEDVYEKLTFYATAYNAGFNKDYDYLKDVSLRANFPRFAINKFRYCEISHWFYDTITIK